MKLAGCSVPPFPLPQHVSPRYSHRPFALLPERACSFAAPYHSCCRHCAHTQLAHHLTNRVPCSSPVPLHPLPLSAFPLALYLIFPPILTVRSSISTFFSHPSSLAARTFRPGCCVAARVSRRQPAENLAFVRAETGLSTTGTLCRKSASCKFQRSLRQTSVTCSSIPPAASLGSLQPMVDTRRNDTSTPCDLGRGRLVNSSYGPESLGYR